MASSSSPLAPTQSSQSWSHDVFLSFRGEDTRKNFIDHLYQALVQQGIDTYKDDKTLQRGEEIGPSLKKAIQESQMALIVFSTNYADSRWCLDELTHIMECKNTRGQIVIPIFYDVEPTDVRHQKGKYGEAFTKHDLENKNKDDLWRKAIVDACEHAGWEPKKMANGHEAQAIKEIVDKISSMLLVTASANEDMVGIAARVQRLKAELQIGSGGVRMVGIWGVGGGGKTTLASAIFDEISRKFDGCCFINNVREESSRHGLETLQEKILSKLEANTSGGGRCLISKRLCYKKVLIVLDDVDHRDQLKSLAGSPDWFGVGSRIIITTRNEHLLKAHEVVVHNVTLLQDDEAIKLFRKHAFRGDIPMAEYEQLSEEVVSYAGGLPLALEVLGSSLCDKNIDQWRSALARLKNIPDNKILEKLKISFDGLEKHLKDLFLDIACFFRTVHKGKALEILDACGFHPVIGVEELRQKALITISEDGRFDMHDLMQEMGHHIVRGEHPNNPEKHSRVWKRKDILTISAMDANTELDMIEAIQYKYYMFDGLEEPPHPPQIAANMRNIRHFKWEADPRFPSANMRNLRYIIWYGDRNYQSAYAVLNNFPPGGLCCLILRDVIVDQLWNGDKYLSNLRKIELRTLSNLIVTPNFDGLPYLERFMLYECPELEEIHSSLGGLERLVCLMIERCWRIKKFPSINRLKKLETLSFSSSSPLLKLSEIQQKVENMGDEDTSSVVRELCKLNHIQLCFSRGYLQKLDLSLCGLGDEDMSSAVWELPNLQELNLSLNNFSRLDFSVIRTPQLKLLDVSSCRCLVELSGLPSSIAVLGAKGCESLETIGDISNCKWLWKVLLWDELYKVPSPIDGFKLLDSMLEANAIEDHLFSLTLDQEIPKRFVGRLFGVNTFRLHLPQDWYHDFCGFLVTFVADYYLPEISIIMKQDVNEDSRFELPQESDQGLEPAYGEKKVACVGYFSFSSLKRTTSLNFSYNVILIPPGGWLASRSTDRIGAALVPRNKSKDRPFQTKCSQFQDGEVDYGSTFTIEDGVSSCVKISWNPRY